MCSNLLKKKKELIRRIENAKAQGGFCHDVTLVAVTKYHTIEETNNAIRAGIHDIGENHVQSLLEKEPKLFPCNRHFIGHLQTNKVKQLLTIDNLTLIQSVDSIKLAKEIDTRAKRLNKTVDVLIQINIANEETKFGIDLSSLPSLLSDISYLDHIKVKGLMAIMPIQARPDYYQKMYALFEDSKVLETDNISMQILSMGMSSDFEQAVRYGSNMIRIGSYLFS